MNMWAHDQVIPQNVGSLFMGQVSFIDELDVAMMEAKGHLFIARDAVTDDLVLQLLPFFDARPLFVILSQSRVTVAVDDEEELDHRRPLTTARRQKVRRIVHKRNFLRDIQLKSQNDMRQVAFEELIGFFGLVGLSAPIGSDCRS
jgi:hypothetical protein